MSSTFSINDTELTNTRDIYTVAELSGNHNQDFDRAVELIEAAAEAGADAVKSQTYRPETMTLDCQSDTFRIDGGTSWDERYLYDLYEEAYTPWEWQSDLKQKAESLGMDFFSTAFDAEAVDYLEDLDVDVHKIASFEIVDLPLIKKAARTGKPLIISTGIASLEEISDAVSAARNQGANEILLLKCTSSYPAKYSEMNLNTIPHLAETFDVPVGLSDHSKGTTVPVTAVSKGICLVEKHFTLSRDDEGPDSHFSMEPDEFNEMVEALKNSREALGDIQYGPTKSEESSKVFRRSIFVVQDLKPGDAITNENIKIIRPGYGLAPKHFDTVLGSTVTQKIKRGTPLTWEHLIT